MALVDKVDLDLDLKWLQRLSAEDICRQRVK